MVLSENNLSTKAFYKAIMQNSIDGITITDENFQVTYLSHSATLITGWTSEKSLILNGDLQTHPSDIADLKKSLEEVKSNPKKAIKVSFRTLHKNGHFICLEGLLTNKLDDKNIKGIIFNFRDITERKRSEELLVTHKELVFQIEEKEKQVADLLIANKELLFQGEEKEKRATELLIANQALVFQTEQKANRTSELLIANKELLFQNDELEQKVKERTEKLSLSEAFNAGILNSLTSHLAVLDKNGNIIAVNDSWKHFAMENGDPTLLATGVGINYYDVCKKAAKNNIEEANTVVMGIRQIMDAKIKDFYLEYACHSPVERRWFALRVVKFESVEPMVVVAHLNITERKEAEEKVEKNEKLFRALIENNLGIISLTDDALNLIYRSPSSTNITGWTEDELNLLGGINYFHPDDIIIVKTAVDKALKNTGIPQPYLARCLHKNGHYIWLEGKATKLPDNSFAKGIVFNASDVTERIKLEQLLHKSNTLAKIGSWEVDLVNGTVYWSDITREIHEAESDFVSDIETGLNFYQKGPDRDLITQKVKEAIELGKPWDVELQIITAKNNERWIRTMGEAEFVGGKCIKIYGSFQDINERKKANEQIKESEQKYHSLIEQAADGIAILDRKGNLLEVNGSFEKLLGYNKSDITGMMIKDLIPKEENKSQAFALKQLGEGKVLFYERILKRKDGTTFSAEINAKMTNKGIVIGYIRDITERKKAEEQILLLNSELEEKVIKRTIELENANKEMEAFSYSISHDLRAPLRAVNGYASMLEEDYGSLLDAEGNRLLGVVQQSVIKMGVLIDNLLAFSRLGRTKVKKSVIDMNELTKAVLSEIKEYSPHIAKIKLNILLPAKADRALLQQVLYNLISNANKFSSKKKKPFIEIASKEENGEIIYSIKDNGVGFDMQYSDKLFGVFQRLHSEDDFSGTGVGLAIVERIINKLDGKVWAEGKLDEGATFFFSLPK
jgi:PAS domain S-box-containing protein